MAQSCLARARWRAARVVTERRFEGRSVLIAGGLGGIGLATARRFAQEGAALLLADLDIGEGAAAAEELTALGATDVCVFRCDVSDEAAVKAACDAALEAFGALHVVVNVAGVMIYKPLEELDAADWSQMMGINLFGAAYFTRQAFLHMSPGGAIVNVSSVHAVETSALVAPYAAAKAALLSLTRSAAIEGRPKGIRANAVLPGAIDTELLRASPNIRSGVESLEPADVGAPSEVAAAIAFLASDEASFITGAALAVDGGRLAKL